MRALDRAVIGLNNLSVRGRRARAKPEHVLLLLPSCLQSAACRQNVVGDLAECRRCGRCKVGPLLDLAGQLGIRVGMARGGRAAIALARDVGVQIVVAIACEKELRGGIIGCVPKAVWAVENRRPNGPCRETDVDVAEVERAVRWLTRSS